MQCPECGRALPGSARRCAHCGATIPEQAAISTNRAGEAARSHRARSGIGTGWWLGGVVPLLILAVMAGGWSIWLANRSQSDPTPQQVPALDPDPSVTSTPWLELIATPTSTPWLALVPN